MIFNVLWIISKITTVIALIGGILGVINLIIENDKYITIGLKIWIGGLSATAFLWIIYAIIYIIQNWD